MGHPWDARARTEQIGWFANGPAVAHLAAMRFAAVPALLLALALPCAARAEGSPFSVWLSYGPSSVSHEKESHVSDDLALGAEYGWRIAGDLSVMVVTELSGLHFFDGAEMPARGGWLTGAALEYRGSVRVGAGAGAGIGWGNKWDLGTDSSGFPQIEEETMFLTGEFVHLAVPFTTVGSWRVAAFAQFQARQYGDGTSSLSGMLGVAFGN